MMNISRRKFLRFAPASVGAIALGAVVWPETEVENSIRWVGHLDADYNRALDQMTETILIAGQKAADPPLMYRSKGRSPIHTFGWEPQ